MIKLKSGTKIVFLQGSFDILNWGHVKAFKQAKSYGDYLIVGLNTNELLKEYKKREPVLPFYQKKFILESIRYVDLVVPAPYFSPLKLLKKYNVDVYCLTKEWKDTKKVEMDYIKSNGGKVKFLPRFKGVICTSDIKKILLEESRSS